MSDSSARNTSPEITGLLHQAAQGNRAAFDQVLPLVYEELNRLARAKLRFERPGHTLNTTALVHEAYLKLVDQTHAQWQNRQQFFAVASEAMRRILIDYAKRRAAAKRGGTMHRVTVEEAERIPENAELMSGDQATELIALDEALDRLAGFNPEGARIVQFRFFTGLSNDEVADVLGSSERTIRRSWTVAKAWLRRELGDRLDGPTRILTRPDAA
jgi:RNA polymerase sigma factor (TIGR02999 family)